MALKDVFVNELRDMYSAENQLAKSAPKLTKSAKDEDLRKLFKNHAEETKEQIGRLREAFEILGMKPTGKHCEGMAGVIAEGSKALGEERTGASFDAGLLGAALRTEHYEIAGYTMAILMAKALGIKDVADLLKENLAEEEKMAKHLHSTAKDIFKKAARETKMDGDVEPPSKKSKKDKDSERESEVYEQNAGVKREVKSKSKAGKKAKPAELKAEEETAVAV